MAPLSWRSGRRDLFRKLAVQKLVPAGYRSGEKPREALSEAAPKDGRQECGRERVIAAAKRGPIVGSGPQALNQTRSLTAKKHEATFIDAWISRFR
jgi:hypothetical protein